MFWFVCCALLPHPLLTLSVLSSAWRHRFLRFRLFTPGYGHLQKLWRSILDSSWHLIQTTLVRWATPRTKVHIPHVYRFTSPPIHSQTPTCGNIETTFTRLSKTPFSGFCCNPIPLLSVYVCALNYVPVPIIWRRTHLFIAATYSRRLTNQYCTIVPSYALESGVCRGHMYKHFVRCVQSKCACINTCKDCKDPYLTTHTAYIQINK